MGTVGTRVEPQPARRGWAPRGRGGRGWRGRHTSGPVYQHTSTCVCSCGRASVPVGGPPCRPPNRASRLVMPLRALSLLLTPLPYSSSFRMFPLSSSPRLLRWRPVSLALLAAPSAQQPSCPVSLGPPPCPPCCPASWPTAPTLSPSRHQRCDRGGGRSECADKQGRGRWLI